MKTKSAPEIPTASTGDIAFLIIIFFMTTSIFGREKGLKVVLPEKGSEVRIRSENVLPVAVNPAGQVLLGSDPNPVSLPSVS
ncbi:MAG: biopolymer transporter ExbD, partial [candidate division WOR-3 bacterium]